MRSAIVLAVASFDNTILCGETVDLHLSIFFTASDIWISLGMRLPFLHIRIKYKTWPRQNPRAFLNDRWRGLILFCCYRRSPAFYMTSAGEYPPRAIPQRSSE